MTIQIIVVLADLAHHTNVRDMIVACRGATKHEQAGPKAVNDTTYNDSMLTTQSTRPYTQVSLPTPYTAVVVSSNHMD